MYELSDFKRKALIKAQDIFQSGSNNPLYCQAREEIIYSNLFHDGKNQWPQKFVDILKERGQDIVVLNKIKPLVNLVCGHEVSTRRKIAYRSHSGHPEKEMLAKGVTHYGLAVQEMEDFSFKGSLRTRDAAIGGIGWSNLYLYQNRIYYEYVNSLDVVWDANDFSPQMTNQEFSIRMRFMSLEQKKRFWPKFAKLFEERDSNSKPYSTLYDYSAELQNRQSSLVNDITSTGGRTPVVEVQYKEPKKFYCGIDKNDYYFSTFDEEKAEKLSVDGDIKTEMGTQVIRTVYYQDLLLNHSPLYPDIPNDEFSLIPLIWNRRLSDSLPVGMVDDLKDLQREINYRKAKELNALNSVRVVMDADAFVGSSMEEVREEAGRSDGILLKERGADVQIIPNIDQAERHLRASERNDKELQQISGIFSDSLGEPTNAQSGVAIQERKAGTAKNLTFNFDALTFVKKREGKVLLDLIQGGGIENIYVEMLDEDEKQSIVLNLTSEVDGEQVVFNDVRTLPLEIYVEPIPDYDSSPEEQQATLEALLANQSAPFILQNPELLKLLRFRNADKIASAMQALQQQQIALENRAAAPANQNQDIVPSVSPLASSGVM